MKIFFAAIVVALLTTACSPDSAKPSPTTSPTATGTPAATETTPTGENFLDVNGRQVPLYPATIEQPLTSPRNLSLVLTHGCWGCDVPDQAIERITWDANGTMRTETLFSAKDKGGSYITGIGATTDGSVLVAGVCVRSYCGPMGSDFLSDSRVTVFRSLDGGVSWTELATVNGYAFPLGVASDGQAIVLRQESATLGYVGKLPSGDRFATPAAAADSDWPAVFGGEPLWDPDRGITLVSPSGTWTLDLPAGSRVPRVTAWGRGAVIYQWSDQLGAGAKTYFGDPYEDGPLRVAWEVPPIEIEARGWLMNGGGLVGNASFDNSRRLPVLIVQGPDPNQLSIQAVDVPLFPAHDRNRVVSGTNRPLARVSSGSECLNVRAEPSASATSLGCFANGVLLPDLGETAVVDGRTWVKVFTPTPPDDWVGKTGWAAAEFLQR